MERYQQQAWECLTPKEQNTLFFSKAKGLSTWEGGEILKLAHYKYLEIKARAGKFFKMFSDYFEKYPSLVNPEAPLDNNFRDFIFGAMVKRLPKIEARLHSGDPTWVSPEITNRRIVINMERLRYSKSDWDKDLYALITEFDRWNNYRILPRSLQAPSAFNRRVQRKQKLYVRYLYKIPTVRIQMIYDKYHKKGPTSRRYWISLINETIFPKNGYGIIPISRDEKVLEELCKLRIYVFETKLDAEKFGVLLASYFESIDTIPNGLDWWKTYRTIISKAINFKNLDNTDYTSDTLDNAYSIRRRNWRELKKNNIKE